MSKIWERNRGYTALRPYVDLCTRLSYRKFRIEGTLPESGAVLIAPNHCNTLMDALVVLRSRRRATVFGARADIFEQKTVAAILRFLRILPMVRRRDGIRNVLRNYEIFDEVDEVLANNVPFCMFAEGRHRPMHSLLPIGKGIARIAFASAAKRPTVVVPTGIDYTDFFHYRGACEVRYGAPLDINAFIREHEGLTEPQMLQELRGFIELHMAEMVEPEGPKTEKPHPLMLLAWPLAAFLSFPIWCTAEILCRKVRDKAWCNSIRFLCHLLLLPPTILIWGIIFGLILPWTWTLPLLLSTLLSFPAFYDGLTLLQPTLLRPKKKRQ